MKNSFCTLRLNKFKLDKRIKSFPAKTQRRKGPQSKGFANSLRLCVFACAFIFNSASAQEYLWPTDASRFMTSSFGESRPRRFHAAIDIKTWNRTGYKVFATRSGYVERISVSPFGYGRALYLRLDTGETVVYAHLERFNDRLQEIVEREQERQGAYRIEKYFNADELPVQQGALVGFTGQSGIGVPHLHFEMRDAQSRPINPLRKKFGLVDKAAPSVKEIAVSPLTAGAMVDGDFVPRSYSPVLLNGRLTIPQPIRVSGKIGFAVDAFDRTTGVNNQFAVYRYQLFIDGSLQFQSQFDRFSYSENRLIELVQDYYLLRHDWGRFHKLYREAQNTLEIYSNLNSEDGVILVAGNGNEQMKNERGEAGRGLSWGLHDFLIVTEDFDGNRTTVEGQLLAGPMFELQVSATESQATRTTFNLSFPVEYEVKNVTAQTVVERWLGTRKPNWRTARAELTDKDTLLLDAQAFASAQNDSLVFPQPEAPPQNTEKIFVYGDGAKLFRIQAQNQYGVFSLPAFAHVNGAVPSAQPFHLEVKKDFLTHYLRVEVGASLPLLEPPLAIFSADGREVSAALLAQEPNRYVAAVPLVDIGADSVLLTVTAQSVDGSRSRWEEKFSNVAITPERGGKLQSADGRMSVRFESSALYWPLYGRVEIKAQNANHPLVIGPVYRVEPQDVPFRANALIEIEYPDSVSDPSKLGIASRNKERWNFIASKRNTLSRTLSTEVSSLEEFAIMKDEEPPLLAVQSPAPGVRTKTRRPQISCRVVDHISGFDSERDIQLRLDGKLLIAEYDPERELALYRPKTDLTPGAHVLTARAKDQCGNVTEQEVRFVVP